jgi:hypothetical protein
LSLSSARSVFKISLCVTSSSATIACVVIACVVIACVVIACVVIACVVIACVVGCDGPHESAQGYVEFSNGEPVQSGSVEFRSLIDGRRYASRIESDGAFTLTNNDGNQECPPGTYEVVVVQIVLTEDLAADLHTHGRTVPRRYADY